MRSPGKRHGMGLRRLPSGACVLRSLGGWPLPTMADGDALHIARTKASSLSGLFRDLAKPSGLFQVLLLNQGQLAAATRKHQRLEAFDRTSSRTARGTDY